jgi:AmmeMemoRadiSam system protein B
LIAPHAGYVYSGQTAADGYRSVAELGRPSVVIILGANHTGLGGDVALDDHDAWRTPLGDTPVALDIVSALAERGLRVDRSAFAREHSIEVQLPFLQGLWGQTVPIVPICIRSDEPEILAAAARAIVEVLDARGPALLVASSDFTHYEPEDVASRRDKGAIATILSLNPGAFLELCSSQRLSICGAGAIALLLCAARHLALDRPALVRYATSAEASGDRSAVVGYAAITLEREGIR